MPDHTTRHVTGARYSGLFVGSADEDVGSQQWSPVHGPGSRIVSGERACGDLTVRPEAAILEAVDDVDPGRREKGREVAAEPLRTTREHLDLLERGGIGLRGTDHPRPRQQLGNVQRR